MICLGLTLVILVTVVSSYAEKNNITDEDTIVVKTSYGPVKGFRFVSNWTKQEIYAFRGIPYASPPVGNMRFKDPVLPNKWMDVKDCMEDQAACPQVDIFDPLGTPEKTDEDCLYLNVYTPQVTPEGGPLPVMVWVHGGGFLSGSGSYNRYGPDFLVGEGVVFVSFNYRLGAIGFLTMGTHDIPGNAGLKDQRLVLLWVQQEIRQFGGDPTSVTLFGESAGSASVHLHYLSPMSKGMFHRVIGESGTGLGRWAVRTNGIEYGLQLAAALNCSTADTESAQRCLMAANVEAIVKAQFIVKASLEDKRNGDSLVFIPTVDKDTSNEPFLPDLPYILVDQRQGSFVPFLMGVNSEEGMLSLAGSNEEDIKNFTNNLKYVIPPDIRNKSSDSQLSQLVELIKQFYFNNTDLSSLVRGYVDINTDIMFGYPTAVSARAFHQRANVYLYYFSFNGTFKEEFAKYIASKFNFTGVSHAEEMSYIFVRSKVNQSAIETSDEMIIWRRLVRMWTNFAKFGFPTMERDPILQNVTWSSVGNSSLNFLHIDTNMTMMESDLLGPRVALWDSITHSSSSQLHVTGLITTAGITIVSLIFFCVK